MPFPLRTFVVPVLVLIAALAFSVFMAYRHPASPQANLAAANQVPAIADTLTKNYYDGTYHFDFDYPADATIQQVPNDDGDVILLTRQEQDLEIHITPWDSAPITEADIRNEAGDSLVHGPTRSLLADCIPLLRADISFPNLGLVSHAWFLRRGYQYELMAGSNAQALLDSVLTTWCFRDVPLPVTQDCAGKLTP